MMSSIIKKKSRKLVSKSLDTKFFASSTKIAEIHDSITQELNNHANPLRKVQIEKYMKHTTQYRGLNAPQVNQVFKKFWPTQIQSLGLLSDRTDLAETFLKSSYGEDKTIGMMIFGKIYKELDQNYIENKIKPLFLQKHIIDWAICDGICCKFLRFWGEISKENTEFLSTWSKEENIWLKRASCVAFVTRAKHGDKKQNFEGFLDILLGICETVVKCNERFAQLGCGWLLREISVSDKEKAKAFIKKNINNFSREGLKYAVEKMNEPEATRILAEAKKDKNKKK